MIQPGRESNLPTSSGQVGKGSLGMSLFSLNGFSVTLGMVILLVAVALMWQYFFARKRRR